MDTGLQTMKITSSVNSTLWRWICKKLISLTIGSMIVVAFCMWLRFFVENQWVLNRIPEDIRAELVELQKRPLENPERFHQLIDQWYGIDYWDPNLTLDDWGILAVLMLAVTPFIFFLTLRAAKPISESISQLAEATQRVTDGDFGKQVDVPTKLPLEIRQLNENFNEMSKQLARYETELKQTNASMAHELRTPLTAAIGRLQGIIDGVFEPQEAQLSMIMKQLAMLNHLVDDLHLLTLTNANNFHLNILPHNIRDIIKEKAAWAAPMAKKIGMTINCSIKEDITCNVDSYRIGQVFLILIDNALKYAAEGKKIDISYQVNDNSVSIIFRDYGPAVPQAFLTEIFTPFARADKSRARHSGGSGLGLAIAQAICKAHQGQLNVERNNDKGLSFTVTLIRR